MNISLFKSNHDLYWQNVKLIYYLLPLKISHILEDCVTTTTAASLTTTEKSPAGEKQGQFSVKTNSLWKDNFS